MIIFKFILASIILLMASFNVNALQPYEIRAQNEEQVRINNQLLADEANRNGTNYTPQISPLDAWEIKRVNQMNAEKALEFQQQQIRQQLMIQQQQRYMNQ